ncbi:DUF4145 domain-containing protein [Nonomuraea bangladeshensis]|uniref:DUF4145 domain-containing protein n=1 Tax=Nonomuraea bangladeshensis TaxID=404385 RepID=UPI003C2C3454
MGWEDRLERPEAVPMILRQALDEVERCIVGKAYTATVTMVRRGLEALCRDQGVARGQLHEKLHALHTAGKIDNRLLDWATHLRHVGNEGAHDLDFAADELEATDAQALLEGMLRYLYVDQARYEEAKTRREHRRLPTVTVLYIVTESGDPPYRWISFLWPEVPNGGRKGTIMIDFKIYQDEGGELETLQESLKELRIPVDQHLRRHGVRVGEWREASDDDLNEPPF